MTANRIPADLSTKEGLEQGVRLIFNALVDHDDAIKSIHDSASSAVSAVNAVVKQVTQIVSGSYVTLNESGKIDTTYLPLGGVNQQAADYTLQSTDFGGGVFFSGTSALTFTLNSAVSRPFYFAVQNNSTSTVTMAPTSGQIDGNANLILQSGESAFVFFDGLAWWTVGIIVPSSGATGARPTGIAVGFQFFDTTLGVPIWWNGTNWVNATGTTV